MYVAAQGTNIIPPCAANYLLIKRAVFLFPPPCFSQPTKLSDRRAGWDSTPLADLKWVELNSKKGDLTDLCTNQQHLNPNLNPTVFWVFNSQQRIPPDVDALSILPQSYYQCCKSNDFNFLKVITGAFNINASFNYVLSCWFPITSLGTQTFKTWIIHHSDHNVSFNVPQSYIIVKLRVGELISSQMDSKSTQQQGFPVMRNASGGKSMQKHWWGLISVLHVLQPAFNIRSEVSTTAVYFQVMSFKSVSFIEKYLKWVSIHRLPLTCPSGTLTDSITPGIECEMIKWVWGSYESISPIIWEIKTNTDVNTKRAAEKKKKKKKKKRFRILAPAQILHRGKVS